MTLKFGGLTAITTRASRNFSIVKLEWPTVRYFVPSGANLLNAQGEAVPWAWRSDEIARKAFLVRIDATSADDGSGFAYLYLDAGGWICQSPYNGGAPVYEVRTRAFESDGMKVELYDDRIELHDVYAPEQG